MNKKAILICTCVLALGFAGLPAFAHASPDQTAPQTQNSPAPQTASPSTPSATSPSAAQSQGQDVDPELAAKIQARLQQINSELNLSDDQKAQIKPIVEDMVRRMNAVKTDPQRSIESKRNKIDEIRDNARGQMRQFLTPDQSKKLDTLKESQEDYPQ
jgi:Spy/CpxP family protein refolding chaperone